MRNLAILLAIILLSSCSDLRDRALLEVRSGVASATKMGLVDDPALRAYLGGLVVSLSRSGLAAEDVLVVKAGVRGAALLPGGVIAVPVDVFDTVQSEAELVFVLAHEIAHYEMQHRHGHGRALADELAADRRAMQMIAHAGYNPFAALSLLERRLAAERGDGRNELIKRVQGLQKLVPHVAAPLYAKNMSADFQAFSTAWTSSK